MSDHTSRETAIEGLQRYRAEIESKIAKLKQELKIISHSISLLTGESNISGVKRSAGRPSGPQQVVQDFLEARRGEFFRPSEAAAAIRQAGYAPTNPKLWSTQVTVAMRRLEAKGIIKRTTTDGKSTYGVEA